MENIQMKDEGKMEMTIKQLANELGVSKPTIRKVISELGFQDKLRQVGNRYMLSDTQISQIKLQILKKTENEIQPKTEKSENTESEAQPKTEKSKNMESEVQPKTEKSENTESDVQSKTKKSENTIFIEQLSILNKQLAVKDYQIHMLQNQLVTKDSQISLLQEQISQLTTAMENMSTALAAAQALHAGTIQKQLTEYSVMDQSSNKPEQPKQKQGLFSRFFGKK